MLLNRLIFLQQCQASQGVHACCHSAAKLKVVKNPAIESNKNTITREQHLSKSAGM